MQRAPVITYTHLCVRVCIVRTPHFQTVHAISHGIYMESIRNNSPQIKTETRTFAQHIKAFSHYESRKPASDSQICAFRQ